MAIRYSIKDEGDFLRVTTSGEDDNLQQVQDYGMAIIQEAVRLDIPKVLCDELDLVYRLDSFDIFKSAEFIATNAPKIARIAIVVNPKQISDAHYWETVAVNRGLTVRIFKTVEDAESWLQSK